MENIHTARTLADAYMARDVLAAEGIRAMIRNEHLVGVAGEVPVTEALPTLAVATSDAARASAILREHLDDAPAALLHMDAEANAGDDDAQAAMGELYTAAGRLLRNPRRGEAIDVLQRYGAVVAAAPAPFGVAPEAWSAIGNLANAVVAAAADEEQVLVTAAQLRQALAAFV